MNKQQMNELNETLKDIKQEAVYAIPVLSVIAVSLAFLLSCEAEAVPAEDILITPCYTVHTKQKQLPTVEISK